MRTSSNMRITPTCYQTLKMPHRKELLDGVIATINVNWIIQNRYIGRIKILKYSLPLGWMQ